MRRVIVLRPEPGASETVEQARERGLDAIALPLFAIEPVAWDGPDPQDFDGLLLTSANAVRRAGPGLESLRGLPVHAVGEATAKAARTAGLKVATVGNGGIDALLASIDPGAKLLHLCGQDRRMPTAATQAITPVTVYRSRALDPPPELAALEEAVVLVHSPRAASCLAELALDRSGIHLAAINPAAGEAAGSGWAAVEVAATPTDDALLALAEQLCDKARRG
jgi:uroporphyrinogen-III synthase